MKQFGNGVLLLPLEDHWQTGTVALILLDTNICIHLINSKPAEVLQRFRAYRMGEIRVCSAGRGRPQQKAVGVAGDLERPLRGSLLADGHPAPARSLRLSQV